MNKKMLAVLLAGTIFIGGQSVYANNMPTPPIEEPAETDVEDLRTLVINQANAIKDEDAKARAEKATTYEELYNIYVEIFNKIKTEDSLETDENKVDEVRDAFIERVKTDENLPEDMKKDVIAKVKEAKTLDEVNRIIAQFNPQGQPEKKNKEDGEIKLGNKTYVVDYLGNIKGGFKKENVASPSSHYDALKAKFATLEGYLDKEDKDYFRNKIYDLSGSEDLAEIVKTHKELNNSLIRKVDKEDAGVLYNNNIYLDECLNHQELKEENKKQDEKVVVNKGKTPKKEKKEDNKGSAPKKVADENVETGVGSSALAIGTLLASSLALHKTKED